MYVPARVHATLVQAVVRPQPVEHQPGPEGGLRCGRRVRVRPAHQHKLGVLGLGWTGPSGCADGQTIPHIRNVSMPCTEATRHMYVHLLVVAHDQIEVVHGHFTIVRWTIEDGPLACTDLNRGLGVIIN